MHDIFIEELKKKTTANTLIRFLALLKSKQIQFRCQSIPNIGKY